MTRRVRKASLWPWLAAAALLHAVLSLLLRERPSTTKPSAPTDATPTNNQLEVVLLDESFTGSPANTTSSPHAQPTKARKLGHEGNTRTGAPSTRVFEPVSSAPKHVLPSSETAEAKVNAANDAQVPEVASSEASTKGSPADATLTAPQTTAAVQKPAPIKAPRSLAELGYGTPHPAAITPYLGIDATANAQNRLDQNLAQAIIDRDRDRSNGIEGPVTQALHTAAMAVVVPTSLSKISVIIGSNGKLADFHIISTNQDARALAKLSERLKQLLAAQTVRVPNGRAVEFTYEIKSAVLLPSGRAPGLGVEVLGIPVKEGRADNSSKISILTPKFKFGPVSEPDPERNGKVTQSLPQLAVGISVLGLDGDMVDLGANERQVVHTRLIRQRVL